MNRIQKMSLWLLIWISAGIALAAIAVAILIFVKGLPWSTAKAGLGFIGIGGFGGLGFLIFKKDPGKVSCDERDRLINTRAALAGFGAAYLVTGLACMLPFFIMGPNSSISAALLPWIFMASALICFLVHSAAILIQYGWRGEKS